MVLFSLNIFIDYTFKLLPLGNLKKEIRNLFLCVVEKSYTVHTLHRKCQRKGDKSDVFVAMLIFKGAVAHGYVTFTETSITSEV